MVGAYVDARRDDRPGDKPGDQASRDGLARGSAARTARIAALPIAFTGRAVAGWGRRLAGADRFATSAAISREAFPNGSATVYLARSDDPADALSASALPGGPVLVVPSCGTLPATIAEEIRRLGATRVTALGGPSAICDSLLAQAAAA